MTPGELVDLGLEVERALVLAADPVAPREERHALLEYARAGVRALVCAHAAPDTPGLRTALAFLHRVPRTRPAVVAAQVALEALEGQEVTR